MDYLQEHPEERTAAEKKQLDAVRRATSRQGRNPAAVVNPTAATQPPKAVYGDKRAEGLSLKPLTAQEGKDSKNNQSEEELEHNEQTLLDIFLPDFLKDNKPGSEPDDKELLDEDEEKQLEEIDNSSRLPHGKVKSNKTGYLHSR